MFVSDSYIDATSETQSDCHLYRRSRDKRRSISRATYVGTYGGHRSLFRGINIIVSRASFREKAFLDPPTSWRFRNASEGLNSNEPFEVFLEERLAGTEQG